jgi:hypothetical protein
VASSTINSDGFKSHFNSFIDTCVRNLCGGTHVRTIQVEAAGNGDPDWVGLTHSQLPKSVRQPRELVRLGGIDRF